MPPPVPEALRLFALCQGMEWTHLPRAGGIYDQHPELLDAWDLIFVELAAEEKRKQKDRERESKKKKSRSSGGRRGRRRP